MMYNTLLLSALLATAYAAPFPQPMYTVAVAPSPTGKRPDAAAYPQPMYTVAAVHAPAVGTPDRRSIHPWKVMILDTDSWFPHKRPHADPGEYAGFGSGATCSLFPDDPKCPGPMLEGKLLEEHRKAEETAQRDVGLQPEKSWASDDYKRSMAHSDIVMPGMLTDEQVEDMRKELAYLNICLDNEDEKKADQCAEKIENIWKRLRIEQKLREDKFPFNGGTLGGKYAQKGLEGAKMPRSPKQPLIRPLVTNTTSLPHNDRKRDLSPGDKDALDGLWADSAEEYEQWAAGFEGFE